MVIKRQLPLISWVVCRQTGCEAGMGSLKPAQSCIMNCLFWGPRGKARSSFIGILLDHEASAEMPQALLPFGYLQW